MSGNIIKLVRETWTGNIIFMAIAALFMVIFKERSSLIVGLLLGSAVAMLNFLMIAWNTEQIMDKADSFIFSFGVFYIIRIVLSAVCIYLGIRYNIFNLFTIVLGLFSIRISMTFATVAEMFWGSLKKKES